MFSITVKNPTLSKYYIFFGKSLPEFVYFAVEICHRGPLPSATPSFSLRQKLCESAKHQIRRSAWVGQADFRKVEPNNENHSGNCQRLSVNSKQKIYEIKLMGPWIAIAVVPNVKKCVTVILFLFIQLNHEHFFVFRMMYERFNCFDCRYDESEKSTSAKITSSTICLVSSSTNWVVGWPTLLRSNDTSRIFRQQLRVTRNMFNQI